MQLSLFNEEPLNSLPVRTDIKAILSSREWNPAEYCKGVNNGRTGGTSFYSNERHYNGALVYYVAVSNWRYEMSPEDQVAELNWFLSGKDFTLIYL